jgi:pimeloyl-ACP methyl ester carboxylesterase
MSRTSVRGRGNPLRIAAAVASLAVAGSLMLAAPATAQSKADATADATVTAAAPLPTVVLVHGAFADASSWSAVIAQLQRSRYPVIAVANPMRGLEADAEHLRSVLSTISGPVVLVGHSYGGAVITDAATGDPDVKSLVYVAGYALQEGEHALEANELGGGHTDLGDHLVIRDYPGAAEGDGDVYVDPAHFGELIAADLPRTQRNVLAAVQRPVAYSALLAPSGAPAWASIPSWYLVSVDDEAIPVEAERAMAERAGSTTVEIRSSHASMLSHPRQVVQMIVDAAK